MSDTGSNSASRSKLSSTFNLVFLACFLPSVANFLMFSFARTLFSARRRSQGNALLWSVLWLYLMVGGVVGHYTRRNTSVMEAIIQVPGQVGIRPLATLFAYLYHLVQSSEQLPNVPVEVGLMTWAFKPALQPF